MLHLYTDIHLIRSHMTEVNSVNYCDVFRLYKDISGEYNKWLTQHGEEMTSRHFKKYEEIFQEKQWQKGIIRIQDLYPVSMCIGPGWIKKLACSKINCINHSQNECENCIDFEENKTPTLGKVVSNYHLNINSIPAQKIESIRNSFLLKEPNEDNVFIIIIDNNPPYVFDGNSRLISIATTNGMENMSIICYLGETSSMK